jgi:hypothetical protein
MIVSNKLKNNETIIGENCAVVNVEWKKYPAAIVYLVDNPWITEQSILLAVQGLSPMVSDLVLSKPYTVSFITTWKEPAKFGSYNRRSLFPNTILILKNLFIFIEKCTFKGK